jgi:transposase InsO family protein
MALRDELQKIALQVPAYGYRRLTAELQRRGQAVNHKRVLRLMRADNLLCLRRKSFVRTTDSAHGWPVYPNLAATLQARGCNQLWVADLTYIRLLREFVYLAVVLDAWSRRVVGWALGETLEAELTVTALRMAIEQRRPQPGLVHHSDRGVQYACGAYRELPRRPCCCSSSR